MVLHIVVDMVLSLAVSISSSLLSANSVTRDEDEKVTTILLRKNDVSEKSTFALRIHFTSSETYRNGLAQEFSG